MLIKELFNYIIAKIYSIYLMIKFIIENIIAKRKHDYLKNTTFDYCPDFSGRKCGRPGCW